MTIDDIIQTVGDYYGVSVRLLVTKPPLSITGVNLRASVKRRSTDKVVFVKQMCMFFLYRCLLYRTDKIGMALAYHDHTAVSKAHKKIINYMAIERTKRTQKDVDAIIQLLTEKFGGTPDSDLQLSAIKTYRAIDELPDGQAKEEIQQSMIDFASKILGWQVTGPQKSRAIKNNLNENFICQTQKTLTLSRILQNRLGYMPAF